MPAPLPIDTAVYDIGHTSGGPPGAGNNFQFTVPANSRYHILNLNYNFSTSAAVADRYHAISVTINANIHLIGLFAQAQTASLTWQFHWHAGLSQHVDLTANNLASLSMGSPLILSPGDTLQTNILGIDGGDTLANIDLIYRRWIIA